MELQTPGQSFETLKTDVLTAIQSHFPYEGRRQKVVLDNLRVDDKLSPDDIHNQAEVKEKDGTWGVPIRGDLKLIDKVTGKVVDTKANAVLARLPKLTNRYSFIVNGSEYQVDHLFRLKSGAYARIQKNGDLETEFNLSNTKRLAGNNFSVKLDRESKKFFLKYGGTHVPLYPVLKSMGVPDDRIESEWGKAIYDANRMDEKKSVRGLHKFWNATADEGTLPPKNSGEYAKYVHDLFSQTTLRPDTTAITMGKPFTTVNGDALAIASKKLLGISRGEQKPDDRDSLAFKEIASVEDFIPQKIANSARNIQHHIRKNVDHKESVGDIIPPDLFNRPIHEFFTRGGSVAERSEQTNPIQMLSASRKTTLMSKDYGGIKGDHNLTSEMQVVNPSHFGFLDPMHTPESEKTGITLHLSANARKVGKDLETPAYDLATGKIVHLPVIKFHQATAVLPDQVKWKDGKPVPISKMVKVKLPGGEIETRPYSEAGYVMPSSKGLFDYASNLIPFLPTDQGNRVSMADKQLEQAISLKHREVPLVQSKTDAADPEHTFEKVVGGMVTTNAPVSGKVTHVGKDTITIGDGKNAKIVQLYDHFPLNDPKGMMHSEPVVKVGDKVEAGQVIADNNFTKGGRLAIGTNLQVGYIPYKGYNFEDGIVISETAAKKLTSEHLYKKDLELDPTNDKVSKEKLKAFGVVKSATMTKEQWDNLDEGGVIKPGTRIRSGQVLIAAVGKNTSTRQGSALAAMGKRAWNPLKNKSLTWDEDHEGVVTKVVRAANDKNIRVYVKTEEPAVVGDKLTGRHGNKGIITRILPDHEMPHTLDAEGERKHLEVLLNPSGVPTRINVGQMLETAAGKIAQKTGKTYVVDNFAGPDHDYRQQVLDDLKTHGLTDEEQVFDPTDVRKALGSVLVGPQYLLKLKHQVEKKLTSRGGGTTVDNRGLPYDSDRQPKKGGPHGGQGFGQLDFYTLLGHNARHNIRELATYKSDMQDQTFWSMIQEGHEPPPPKPPFSYQKFTALLQGLGVNVTKDGTAVRLLPMTNKEILRAAGNGKNEIKEGNKTILSKNLKPEAGGLFDPMATGGMDGDKWSYMKLVEPVPNPIFVGQGTNKPGPVPVLLGLKMKEIDDIMAGRMVIEGKLGGAGIEAALKKIDVAKEIDALKAELPHLGGATLDRTNKKLKYLLALKEAGLRPDEAYILHNIPILPPKFRPAIPTAKGDINYGPLNGLYKNIALVNSKLKEVLKDMLPEHQNPKRAQLWDAVRALESVGNYKPVYDVDSSGNRELKGILDTIGGGTGEQPKEGYFQKRLIKRRQDLSIRSTVIPEPAMGIDEVGLPRHAAMELYKPFVVAQLGKWGMDPLTAQDEIKKDTAMALKALVHATEDRPILLKRDPVLHKFSIMAFKPKIIEGKAIQIHPLVTGGFNADFDGDAMAGTVPLSREAVEEAKKMFPSKNLYSPTTGQVMYGPSQESLLGLHMLSQWGKDSGKTFESVASLSKAVDRGELHVTDRVKVKGLFGNKPTTLGRILIESRLPRKFVHSSEILHSPEFEMTSKMANGKITPLLAKEHESDFPKVVNSLKDLGNEYSYKLGFSIGLKDLAPLKARSHPGCGPQEG